MKRRHGRRWGTFAENGDSPPAAGAAALGAAVWKNETVECGNRAPEVKYMFSTPPFFGYDACRMNIWEDLKRRFFPAT